jgi:hypothetical protein
MMQKMYLHVNTEFEHEFLSAKKDASESFLLFLLANMLLVGRFDFLSMLFAKLEIDIDREPDALNSLETS